ncbi:MAG: hypothetical protein ACREOF_21765 [Gemmatimonadales bacterium]
MHTVKIIAGGFALLALCLLIGRIGGVGVATAAKAFLPLWLIAAGVNMYVGVARAGYSVAEEAPVFAVVFAVPAAAALLVWWRYSQ